MADTKNSTATIYGFYNCVFYNIAASGDVKLFPSREARDAALAALRETATDKGLSAGAARAGIYPVSVSADDLTPCELDDVLEASPEDGVRYVGEAL